MDPNCNINPVYKAKWAFGLPFILRLAPTSIAIVPLQSKVNNNLFLLSMIIFSF